MRIDIHIANVIPIIRPLCHLIVLSLEGPACRQVIVLAFGVDRVFITVMPVADINHRRIANHCPEPFEFFLQTTSL